MKRNKTHVLDGIPDFGGSYIIVLKMEEVEQIKVGALGSCTFAPGCYYYCGSAKSGVKKRIKRYLLLNRKISLAASRMKQRPKTFWHIDYLLKKKSINIISMFFSASLTECELANDIKTFEKTEIPFPGFGASDCLKKCGSHLFFSGGNLLNIDKNKFDQHLYLK